MSKLSIIMYHYVRELEETRYPEIKGLRKSEFRSQLKFIKENFNVVTMQQVLAALVGSEDLPTNAALLTFDDGYLDHFVNVFPVLFDEKLQGSFYPPLAPIKDRKLLDVNRVHFVLASAPVEKILETIKKFVDFWQERGSVSPFEKYYSEWAKPNRFDSAEIIFIKRMLQTALPESLREDLSQILFSKYVSSDEKAFASELYMDTHQAKMMVECGMHFGSHGDTHQWLNRLTLDVLHREIDNSLLFLKAIGAPCKAGEWTLSYPYGGWNDDVVCAVRQRGCALAVTTHVAQADLHRDDALLLPRFDTNDFPKTF